MREQGGPFLFVCSREIERGQMADSSDSVSVDVEGVPFGGKVVCIFRQ